MEEKWYIKQLTIYTGVNYKNSQSKTSTISATKTGMQGISSSNAIHHFPPSSLSKLPTTQLAGFGKVFEFKGAQPASDHMVFRSI